MGSNCLKITEPLQVDSLLFTTKSRLSLGTLLINLGVIQLFWTWDHWLQSVIMALDLFLNSLPIKLSDSLYLQYPQKWIIDHNDVIRIDIHARKDETNCNSVNRWSQVCFNCRKIYWIFSYRYFWNSRRSKK